MEGPAERNEKAKVLRDPDGGRGKPKSSDLGHGGRGGRKSW